MSRNDDPLCPRCGKELAIVHSSYGVLPGEKCKKKDETRVKSLRDAPRYPTISMQDRIQSQQDKHGKDILQPVVGNKPNPDFAKAYPKMAEDYFTDEELKSF